MPCRGGGELGGGRSGVVLVKGLHGNIYAEPGDRRPSTPLARINPCHSRETTLGGCEKVICLRSKQKNLKTRGWRQPAGEEIFSLLPAGDE